MNKVWSVCSFYIFYLCQVGYVFVLLAGLRKNYQTDYHETWWKDGVWVREEVGADKSKGRIQKFSLTFLQHFPLK